MPIVSTAYEHILLNDDNVPVITGTKMKVEQMVAVKIAYGWSPEEIQINYPFLSMGQIHSALAYYFDHKDELEKNINNDLKNIDKIQKEFEPSPLKTRLKNDQKSNNNQNISASENEHSIRLWHKRVLPETFKSPSEKDIEQMLNER
jgi:uncharacterized protein (DUF433 family)